MKHHACLAGAPPAPAPPTPDPPAGDSPTRCRRPLKLRRAPTHPHPEAEKSEPVARAWCRIPRRRSAQPLGQSPHPAGALPYHVRPAEASSHPAPAPPTPDPPAGDSPTRCRRPLKLRRAPTHPHPEAEKSEPVARAWCRIPRRRSAQPLGQSPHPAGALPCHVRPAEASSKPAPAPSGGQPTYTPLPARQQ